MNCPNCGLEQFATAECSNCGIIFSRFKSRRKGVYREEGNPELPPLDVEKIDVARMLGRENNAAASAIRQDVLLLGLAFVAAVIAYLFPVTRLILSALVTLIHEFGHAIAGWALGHPSLPAFDLVYGGGITSRSEFQPMIALLIAGGLVWLGKRLQSNRVMLAMVSIGGVLWLFIVTAEWRRELVIASAGHLAEILIAVVFLYMALSGRGLRIPELERGPAAFCGFFVLIHSVSFALRLRQDPVFLRQYRGGKGGMLMNDLESVALDVRIHLWGSPTVDDVAGWLIGFSILPVAAIVIWYFYSDRQVSR